MFRVLTIEEQRAHRKELLQFISNHENEVLMYNYMRTIQDIRRKEKQKLIVDVPHCPMCFKFLPRTATENDLCEKCLKKLGMKKVIRNGKERYGRTIR